MYIQNIYVHTEHICIECEYIITYNLYLLKYKNHIRNKFLDCTMYTCVILTKKQDKVILY